MGPTLAADHYKPGVTVTELAETSLAYHPPPTRLYCLQRHES
jgi:hypothetical protein